MRAVIALFLVLNNVYCIVFRGYVSLNDSNLNMIFVEVFFYDKHVFCIFLFRYIAVLLSWMRLSIFG